jgi:hypothetical protein
MDNNLNTILYVSEYRPENIEIGNKICQTENSSAAYWLSEGDDTSYHCLIDSEASILKTTPRQNNFLDFICKFVWDVGYSPNLLVFKGCLSDTWAVSSLKMEGLFDFPCICILDDFNIPLDGFDLQTLDQFDGILIQTKPEGCKEYEGLISERSGEWNILSGIFKKIKIIEEFENVFCNSNVDMGKGLDWDKIIKEISGDIEKNKRIVVSQI